MPQDQQPKTELTLDEWDERVRSHYKIPSTLWRAMAEQESGNDPSAVSPTGVRGRRQVTKATARQHGYNRDDPFEESAAAGKHLRTLYDELGHIKSDDARWWGALAKYYGGGNAIDRDGNLSERSLDGISNPLEHVNRVARRIRGAASSDSQAPPAATPAQTLPLQQPKPTPRRDAEAALLQYDPRGYDRQGRGLSTPAANEAKRRDVLTGQIVAFEDLIRQGKRDEARQVAATIKQRFGDIMEVGEGQGWPYIKPKAGSGFTAPQRQAASTAPLGDDYNKQSWLERRRRNIATGYESGAQALSDVLARGGDIASGALSGDFRPLVEQAEGAGRGLMKLASAFDPAGNAYEAVSKEQDPALAALERRRAERLKNDPYTLGSNASRERLAAEEAAQPGFAGAVTRGVTSGGLQALPYIGAGIVSGGSVPVLAATGAAQSDFVKPAEAALNIAGATLPVKASRALTPAINRAAQVLPGRVAPAVGRAAGQVGVGGGTNVAMALAAGERDPMRLAETATVGGLLSAYDATKAAKVAGGSPARGVDPAIIEAAAQTPGRTPVTVAREGRQSTFGGGDPPRQDAADVRVRQVIDRYTQRANEINRSNIDPGEKAAQLAQARSAFIVERQAATQAAQEAPNIEPQAPNMAPDAAAPPPVAPALPEGVRVIRQGEQLPLRERGQRQIPMDVELGDGAVETVMVLAPDRIGGQRVNETMLRPMVESAIRNPQSAIENQSAAQPDVTTTGATPAEPPQSRPVAPARQQPPAIQFTQLGPEGLRTARAPEEALLPRSSSRATNTLQRDPGGAILAPASSLPSRKLLPPGRPEDVPTEQLDAPNTREMPAIRQRIEAENALTAGLTTPDAPETQRIPVVRPPIVDQSARPTAELPRQPQGYPEQIRRTAEQVPAQSARQIEEALRQEPQPAEPTGPRRSRTERLPVPKATNDNIGQLRARQEELGRLAYDRRGDFTGDLRDEYNQLTAHIRTYDDAQAQIALGGRVEPAPPSATRPERMAPPPEEREARRAVLQSAPEAETGREIHHTTLGLVTEAANQKGVPSGKLRVISKDGSKHLIQNPRTRGNRQAAFVKPSTGAIPSGALPELRDPNAPPSLLAGRPGPARTGQRISYAIPDEAMHELRDRPKPQFVLDAERRLKDAASGKLAGSGGRQLADATVVTGWKVYETGMNFAAWSARVIKEAGEQVRPHLRAAWDRINKSFSVGALPGETKGGTHLGTAFGGLQGGLKGKSVPKTTPAGDDLTARERLGRKIGTAQTMTQLLNPKTIAQNVIGNAAFSGAKNAATLAAIPVDKVLSLVTKQRQVSTPELRTQFADFADGFADMYHAIRSNDYAALADNRYELNNERVFKGKVGGFFEDTLNIALRAPDRGAYLAAYNDSVQQILKAHEKSKQKFSLDQIHEQAKVEAQQAVFQDSNIISDFTVGLRNLLNKITPFGERANFGLGDLVGLKYARTPANLVARGIEYSPLNFVNAFYKTGKVLAGKGNTFDQRAAALAFGKAFVGSAFGSGMGALLYEMGVITQPEQENRGVQAAERGEGLTGYQVNLSALKRYASGGLLDSKFAAGKKQAGDVLVSYDWLQPWAFSIGMGAAAMKAARNRKADADTLDETLTQIDAVTSTLTDQSILRNIRDIGRYGLESTARKVATDAPASFVPAVLNQARTIIDDRAREISKETGASGMRREALDKVLNKLPGASKRLPERKDVVGRSVPSRLPGAGGAALVPVPGRFAKYDPHPVLTEMQATGSGTAGVSRKPGESEGAFKARRALAAEWRREYGLRLVTSQAYRSAAPEERKAAVDHLNEQIAGQSDERSSKLYLLAPAKVMESALKSEREKRRKAEAAASALR